MIIGISGQAGSGKDTAADILVRSRSFASVAFADPMKRIARDVYKFSFDQLWGPSEARNAPDEQYPREHGPYVDQTCACCGLYTGACTLLEAMALSKARPCFLTPRFALQMLGSEWGRKCYPNTWVDYLIDVAQKLSVEGGYSYSKGGGLSHDWHPGDPNWHTSVVVPDVRFENEIAALRKVGAKLIRIVRPGAGLAGAAGQHGSETEQNNIPDSLFDGVIKNVGTLEDLRMLVEMSI